RCCWAAAKTAAASPSIRAAHCPETLTAYSVARTGLAPQVRTIASTCGPILLEGGGDGRPGAITPSITLGDLTRDGVLPQEGGRRPPWRLLPLLLPFALVSGTSLNVRINSSPPRVDMALRTVAAGKIRQ